MKLNFNILKFFNQPEIESALNYPELIEKLDESFRNTCQVPQRLHYSYASGVGEQDSTLLLMPAWKNRHFVGLKIITVSPYNSRNNYPTIQGIYLLMDAKNGQMIAQFDAKSLTNRRTAASSALASKFLSRKDSSTLLMLGTGALAPEMIRAHCSVRPIKQVFVWGRNFEKAKNLVQKIKLGRIKLKPIENIEDHISQVDIISTATSSPDPLVFGFKLIPGQHIDLVGAFKPTWREADDDVIVRSSVYVDTREGALKESGELLIPMKKGIFKAEEIHGDLFELCRGQKSGRIHDEEITCFVSVGYGLEDLATAELIWENLMK